MRRLGLLVGLLAGVAWADIPAEKPPTLPDTSCVGKAAGAACGDGGRCVAQKVRRPDFSKGSPPTWVVTEVLVCEGSRAAPADSPERSLALLGGALAFLALALGLRLKGGRPGRPAAA